MLDGNGSSSYTEVAMATPLLQQLRRGINRILLSFFPPRFEEGSIPEQLWRSNFSEKGAKRGFEEESSPSFSSFYRDRSFRLRFKRPGIFAWADYRRYRYRNFVLELELEFPNPPSASSRPLSTPPEQSSDEAAVAAGIIFRKGSEGTYYYFLLSDRGYFRFDLVFNGHPRTLIPWTALVSTAPDRSSVGKDPLGDPSEEPLEKPLEKPLEGPPSKRKIKVIALGTSFYFFVDDRWVGELEEDSIESGMVALAGQCYRITDGKEPIISFTSLKLESRPPEVEVEYLRWTRAIKPDPQQRIILARRLLGSGNPGPALVQLRRAFTGEREPDPSEQLLIGRTYLLLGMYDSALSSFESLLSTKAAPDAAMGAEVAAPAPAEAEVLAPAEVAVTAEAGISGEPGGEIYEEAAVGKVEVLYLQNRFDDLDRFIRELPGSVQELPLVQNLLGNSCFALGRFEEALTSYEAAFTGDPAIPRYALNAGGAAERVGTIDRAQSYYREAAKELFRQEEWEELDAALVRLRSLDPDDPVAGAIEGKICFQDGDLEQAAKWLLPLSGRESDDSAVYYLSALIYLHRGDLEAASRQLDRALDLEPAYPLYRFKRAEIDYLSGQGDEAVVRSILEADSENGWACNLLGLILLEKGRSSEAREAFEEALKLLPEASDIAVNLSEALLQQDGADGALQLPWFENPGDDLLLIHRRGVLEIKAGKMERGADTLLGGVELLRRDGDATSSALSLQLREDAAAALLSVDRVPEAERLLSRLIEEAPTASRYLLLGRAALRIGEYSRAEASLRKACEEEPRDPFYPLELALLQFDRARYSEAEKLLHRAESLLEADVEDDVEDSVEAGKIPAPGKTERDLASRITAFRETLYHQGGREYLCSGCSRSWWVPSDLKAPERLRLKGEAPPEAPAGRCPSCGDIYCVSCGMATLKDGRFHCPTCGVPLNLNDEGLKIAMLECLDAQERE